MLATEIAEWSDFFVAMAGAAAALAGLLFVAISINITQILSERTLPIRAGQTVTLLVGALLLAGVSLFPDLSERTLGILSLVVAGFTWGFVGLLQVRERPKPGEDRHRGDAWGYRVATTQTATLPGLVGAIVLLTGSVDGVYFLAAGILLSLAIAVINAWVLMVEILR